MLLILNVRENNKTTFLIRKSNVKTVLMFDNVYDKCDLSCVLHVAFNLFQCSNRNCIEIFEIHGDIPLKLAMFSSRTILYSLSHFLRPSLFESGSPPR